AAAVACRKRIVAFGVNPSSGAGVGGCYCGRRDRPRARGWRLVPLLRAEALSLLLDPEQLEAGIVRRGVAIAAAVPRPVLAFLAVAVAARAVVARHGLRDARERRLARRLGALERGRGIAAAAGRGGFRRRRLAADREELLGGRQQVA